MDAGRGFINIALLRAADISPLVTERTLGPDLELKTNDKTTPRATPKKQQKSKTPKNETGAKLEQTSYEPSQISCAQLLDYETIKLSVSLRYEQQKCRKAIKNELLEEHAREAAFLKKKREELQQGFKEAQEKMLLKRQHEEELISEKAEQHALQGEAKDQREIEALHVQTRRALRLVIFNGISQCQEIFREKYSAVIKMILACQRTEYNKSLKDLIEQFEQLISKLKNNDYGPMELRTAQRICESLEALEQKIITEIEELIKESERQREEELHQQRQQEQQQQQQEQQQQQQEQQQQQQEQQQQQQEQQQQQRQHQQQQQLNEQLLTAVEEEKAEVSPENITSSSAHNVETTSFHESEGAVIKDDGLTIYTQIMSYYQSVVDKVKPLKNDESLKKYRFACQKAINTPINAISAVSPQHMQDKFEKLYGFLNGQTSNDVRVTDHPLGRDYSLLLMAKKFVSQGSTAVSSNQQAAFPIAAVLISLWKLIPELGQLFLAYLYKESPYMVPCFLRQQDDQTAEDFLKQLGYHFTNGQIEPGEMYLKRQAGITRLFAACIVTSGRQMDGPSHPHGLSYAWRWLSKIVSMEPLPDLSATIIMEFLQIVGGPMLRTYGKQFIKLLVYIQRVYFPQLAAVDKGGPKARLELQLNKFLQEGRMELPVGMIPPGYW